MRKKLVILFLIPLVVTAAVSAKPLLISLLNSSFEDWNTGEARPEQWVKVAVGGPVFIQDVGRTGNCCKYEGDDAGDWVYIEQQHSAAFSNGDSASFTVYINKTGAAYVVLSVAWNDSTGFSNLSTQDAVQTGTWEEVTVSTTVPSSGGPWVEVRLRIGIGDVGIVYIDDSSTGGDALAELDSSFVILVPAVSMIVIGLIIKKKNVI